MHDIQISLQIQNQQPRRCQLADKIRQLNVHIEGIYRADVDQSSLISSSYTYRSDLLVNQLVKRANKSNDV